MLKYLWVCSALACGSSFAFAGEYDENYRQNMTLLSGFLKNETEAEKAKVEEFNKFDLVYSLGSKDLPNFTADSNDTLKVMWWNIDCATSVKRLDKSSRYKSNLEENLVKLINSSFRPDVLILGEYCPYYLSDAFEKTLNESYAFKHHLVRNIPQFKTSSGKTNERNGIMVLSDHSLKRVVEDTLYASFEDRKDDKMNRTYLLLEVSKGQKKLYLNPLHIYNPWREYRDQYGAIATLLEIDSGQNNANAYQAKQIVEKNLRNVSLDEQLLIIGDLNSPKNFYAINGLGYKTLTHNYVSLISDTADTYIQGGAFMNTAIDHAFGQNIDALYGRVWPLAGSGHLPIYLVLEH